MKNRIEYFLFLLFSLAFGFLGLNTSRKLSGLLAVIFYYFIPIRKKTVLENLTNAFPEYDEKKIRSIAYNTYKSFLTAFIEYTIGRIFSNPSMKKFPFSLFTVLGKQS